MSSADLIQEFQAANGRLIQSNFDRLQSLGVPSSAWFGSPSLVGAVRLLEADGERYVPGDSGAAACVVPVFTGGPVGQLWDVVDLVAFTVDQPARWWLRKGNGVLLGPDWPDYCTTLANDPLPLFSTPLYWLRAGGRGSCVVDWSAHLPLHLRGVQNIVCDSTALAKRLHKAVHKSERTPSIHVQFEVLNAA